MRRERLISDARKLLEDLGMDAERSNERSAMTLLALAHVGDGDEWASATGSMYTTRLMMDWMRDRLGQEDAANTRETIRRFTLHQFIAGGIVEENADRPDRPINSPKWNYRIVPSLLPVMHAIGTSEYDGLLSAFVDNISTWKAQQEETREMNMVPVTMPDGSVVSLSAGGQNVLIKAMVEEFCSRFAPGGTVLYIDDTDHTHRTEQERLMASIGIEMPERGKAPDLIVWLEDKGWLYLMEACSTHGPIDVIRKRELLELFESQRDNIVFVSCFPDRATMRQYLKDLAWETEAWCASEPDHVMHLDGTRFMGPYGYAVVKLD
ncbi:MAG: hypothetical protein IJ087_08745 [Eggerthellaceae bacterium]|nr:hypothetical protein [Eggerthellaceae bacterium]